MVEEVVVVLIALWQMVLANFVRNLVQSTHGDVEHKNVSRQRYLLEI